MTTSRRHTIRYTNGAYIRINPRQIALATQIDAPDQGDGRNWMAVNPMTVEQADRAYALAQQTGGRASTGAIIYPLDQVGAVLAMAAEFWGQPVDSDGYDMPAAEQPAPAEDTPAVQDDPTQEAVRLLIDEGDTLYRALGTLVAEISREQDTPALMHREVADVQALRDRLERLIQRLPEPELWTIESVAEHLGATSTGSARKTLSRWGVKPVGREGGRGGQSLYSAVQVRDAEAARPGRGARADLRRDAS